MSSFTDETRVRAKFILHDANLVPSALILESIEHAHLEIIERLRDDIDLENPADMLILGETMLAGAHLMRSLASQEALQQKRLTIGGHRIEQSDRFETLRELADACEAEAWHRLAPFATLVPARIAIQASATVPVLGNE